MRLRCFDVMSKLRIRKSDDGFLIKKINGLNHTTTTTTTNRLFKKRNGLCIGEGQEGGGGGRKDRSRRYGGVNLK